MRKTAILIVFLMFAAAAVSCSERTVDIEPSKVMEAIAKSAGLGEAGYESGERELNADDAMLIYASGMAAPDMTPVRSYAIRPGTMESAAEAGIFRLHNKSDAEQVLEMCRRRIQSRQTYFAKYGAEQAKMANNGEARSYGEYVYYVIAADKDAVFKAIEDMLRGK